MAGAMEEKEQPTSDPERAENVAKLRRFELEKTPELTLAQVCGAESFDLLGDLMDGRLAGRQRHAGIHQATLGTSLI
jgi:hypothetical protein